MSQSSHFVQRDDRKYLNVWEVAADQPTRIEG